MWYVVQVQACHEQEIVKKCQRIVKDDEEVFTILSERMERINGEWEAVLSVTFQKYVFVDTTDPEDFWLRLHGIPGLTKLLTVGDEIVAVYPEEERVLRLLGGDDHIIGRSVVHKEGDHVTVISGALVGLEGLVRWVDKRQRWVRIAVRIGDRETLIKLSAEFVRPSEKKLLSP